MYLKHGGSAANPIMPGSSSCRAHWFTGSVQGHFFLFVSRSKSQRWNIRPVQRVEIPHLENAFSRLRQNVICLWVRMHAGQVFFYLSVFTGFFW